MILSNSMQLESNLLLESHDPKPMGGVDILEDLIVSQVPDFPSSYDKYFHEERYLCRLPCLRDAFMASCRSGACVQWIPSFCQHLVANWQEKNKRPMSSSHAFGHRTQL